MNIQLYSVSLKVSPGRTPTFWASLMRCTATLINAFFHWTSQHTCCSSADSRYTQHSHKNKQLSLGTSTNLCGMFREWFSRHFVASLLFKAEICASTEKQNQKNLEKFSKRSVLVWYVRSRSGSNLFKKHIQKRANTKDDCTMWIYSTYS